MLSCVGAWPAGGAGGQDRRRRRVGGRDGQQLLTDVDAHGAPGDAPSATDAARRPELVPPRRELVRQPLAIPVSDARAEVGVTGDPPETERRTVPRPLDVPVNPSRSEATLTLVQKQVGQTRVQFVQARQRSATSCHRVIRHARGARAVRRSAQGRRSRPGPRPPDRRMPVPDRRWRRQPQRSDDLLARWSQRADGEPVVELREDEIGPVGDLRPGAHRRAEAGRHGDGALDRNDERRVTSRGVVGVTRRPRAQDALLDIEGGEFASPHPDEGEARHVRLDRLDEPVGTRRCLGDPRRVREPFPRGDADAIVERAVAALLLKAVCARLAVGAPSDRQLLDAGDLRVDDGTVADRRTDHLPAVRAKGAEQAVELERGKKAEVSVMVDGAMRRGLPRRRPVRAGASRPSGSRPHRAVGGRRRPP